MRRHDPRRTGRTRLAVRERVQSGGGRVRKAVSKASIQRGAARVFTKLTGPSIRRGVGRLRAVLPKRAKGDRTILNPPSPRNIAGHIGPTVVRLTILLALGVLFWLRLGESAGVWSALVGLIVLHLGAVCLVLLKSVSVTVLQDGLQIEPWVGRPLSPRHRTRVWWNEVKRVEHRTHHGLRAAEQRLDLHTIRGQFVLSTRWFDAADLGRLRALLAEEVGAERVSGR
jgi:hypothetical protein